MTIWDNIYKSYLNRGQAWASLKKDLLPEFLIFLRNSDFKKKHALDIGCGDGRYLTHLQNLGFTVDGIDSSETAISMSQKKLNPEANLVCVDMFNYAIPNNKYDLIYSISTIHHGYKKDIAQLIHEIYAAILPGGFIFITLPDVSDIDNWDTFKKHKQLAPGTLSPLAGPEIGLAHSFFDKMEIESLFTSFRELKISFNERENWIIIARK
jgi:SAM-dependent methyltransferase